MLGNLCVVILTSRNEFTPLSKVLVMLFIKCLSFLYQSQAHCISASGDLGTGGHTARCTQAARQTHCLVGQTHWLTALPTGYIHFRFFAPGFCAFIYLVNIVAKKMVNNSQKTSP